MSDVDSTMARLQAERDEWAARLEAATAAQARAEAAVSQARGREQALRRIRDQILSLGDLKDLEGYLSGPWLAELRALGAPVFRISLQARSAREGYYTQFWTLPGGRAFQAGSEYPLAGCPWVAEAWAGGRTVMVPRERLVAAGFPFGEVQWIVEIPLPDGSGSFGASTTSPAGFDAAAIAVLEDFTGALALALQRLRDLATRDEAARELRLDLALERVRAEVWQMRDAEDWSRLVTVTARELRALVSFHVCGADVVDRARDEVCCYQVDAEGQPGCRALRPVHPAVRQAMQSGQPVFGRSRRDPLFSGAFAPAVQSVVYVPFAGGTLSMASTEEDAFGPAEAAVLQRFAPVADEAHRRLQDLLERRRLEQELIRTERLRAVAELSAGVSHNLNNLLTAIMLPAEMLQKTVEDPEARELVDTIASAAKRAADLVRKLHASARAGPDENVGPVVVAEAIARVLRATQSRWQQATAAGGQGVRVVTDLEDVVPIRGTVVGLDDALTNLIGNAIEAMPAGGTLTLRARPDGEWVRVDCSDTGAGMDEETRRRVFEPFFTTKGNVGAGLGLSVVHRTVARWGGRIEVESAVGAGTTFSLFLPPWSEPVRSGVAGPTARRGP